MAGRRGEYLFKRGGSDFWHIRFVYPEGMRGPAGRKKIEFSLRTPCRVEAEAIAGQHIAEHKRALLLNRIIRGPQRTCIGRRFEPGKLHHLDDGTTVFATLDNLSFFDAAGTLIRIEANTESERVVFDMTPSQRRDIRREAGLPVQAIPKKKPATDTDIEHLERWIRHRKIGGYLEKEARTVWATFRYLTENKPLAQCDRDDGRKLVAHYFAKGNVSATVQKKVGHLCALVELAIDEGKLKFNPFAKLIGKHRDKTPRWPMPDNDMKIVRDNLDKLRPDERLLWMLCATTGMRRGEAHSINTEFEEKGIRYVIVGSKTEAALRRVALPDAVLALCPQKIEGPLFEKDVKNLGRNLLRAIRRLGVKGKMKDLHALRHRAKDRLRAEDCPADMQNWLLGHDEMTVSVDYGEGPPVTKLKAWVEKIGF